MDGRTGTIRHKGQDLPGFALMRHRAKGLVAFHSMPQDRVASKADLSNPPKTDQFVVSEDDFIPSPPAAESTAAKQGWMPDE
jgi:hypothetical protein